jgi:hypothetical protein
MKTPQRRQGWTPVSGSASDTRRKHKLGLDGQKSNLRHVTHSLTIEEIAQAYNDAGRLVNTAMSRAAFCHPVWEKVYHVAKYLDRQAAAELAEVLSDATA